MLPNEFCRWHVVTAAAAAAAAAAALRHLSSLLQLLLRADTRRRSLCVCVCVCCSQLQRQAPSLAPHEDRPVSAPPSGEDGLLYAVLATAIYGTLRAESRRCGQPVADARLLLSVL